jgi:ribosome-associated protein
VICSADNERQLRAIIENVDETVRREYGVKPRIEGVAATGWVLLDYNDIVVHVFNTVQRDYYRLERIWSEASPVVVVQ